uniref:UspA domain-containing protein n=1 Tax=Noccaea caerulescens TaxID=107243 RepID=A0A1J3CZN6_NOCCA
MASAHSLAAVSVLAAASKQGTLASSSSSTTLHSFSSLPLKPRELSLFPNLSRVALKVAAKAQSEVSPVGETFSNLKHLLLPVIDRNPYLSEGTRQAAATTTSLANKYGADITVVVIDEEKREASSEHETQVSNIRWHLSQGGFEEFKLLERLGEGKKATAIIGEVADELRMELVVMSMDAIHSKFIDANLLAEFIPCPVLLLPL